MFGIPNNFNPIILSLSEVAVPIQKIQAFRTTVYYDIHHGVPGPFEGIKIYNKGSGDVIGLIFDKINYDYSKLVSELNAFDVECFPGHTMNTRFK